MTQSRPEWIVSPAPIAYPQAMATMEQRVDDIIAGVKPELIWCLEHPPLYTAGTSAKSSDLKDAARFPVYETGRGGQYTYHGPGQRVIYAMIDLRERGKDLRAHVRNLEQWMIDVLAEFGVHGERSEGRVGIWVDGKDGCAERFPSPSPGGLGRGDAPPETSCHEEKIGAIGVRVRKWVAYHGLALNVDPDLSHFSGIVPCGLAEFGVTSLRKLGITATMGEIDAAFRKNEEVLFE